MFGERGKDLKDRGAPLAARMRPAGFDEFIGQEHVTGPESAFRRSIEADRLPSVIFWGPPGSGKTTLASIIALTTKSYFSAVSAVSSGVADLRKVVNEAEKRLGLTGQKTVLFIDEIHRFNKAQQDAILPFVEDGTVTLIGATTENPSFEVVSPLLSRCQVITLRSLNDDEIRAIILRAVKDSLKGLGKLNISIDEDAFGYLVSMADHDARQALNYLEMAANSVDPGDQGERRITISIIEDVVQHRALKYDKDGSYHYDTISALHKTMRGSDPDAAIYWLGRMVEAGEDPLYIARRLIRFASEDIGMADPQALVIAMSAQQAVHFVGMPEARLALAQAVVYLAVAPKSNSLYAAYNEAASDISKAGDETVPLHLRNAVTSLMKESGYGEGYKYAHHYKGHFVRQQNLPDSLKNRRYYHPGDQGFEAEVTRRLKYWWPERF